MRPIYENQKTDQNKKDVNQDSLSFACLELYKYHRLNILTRTICFHKKSK